MNVPKQAPGPVTEPTLEARLFPLAIERLAGMDMSLIAAEAMAPHHAPDTGIDAATRPALCTRLEGEIGALFKAGRHRDARSLLAFKRSFFNRRATGDEAVLGMLEPGLAGDVRAVIARDMALDKAGADAEAAYRAQVQATGASLDRFAEAAPLRTALAFSGQERHRLLRHWRSDGRRVKPGEQRRSHTALLQFAARAAAKTTPFSYFGSAALIATDTCGPDGAAGGALLSRLTLDPAAVRRLVWGMVLGHAPLRQGLMVGPRADLRRDARGGYAWSACPIDLSVQDLWGARLSHLSVPAGAMAEALSLALERGAVPLSELRLNEAQAGALLVGRALEPVDMPGEQEPILAWLMARLTSSPLCLRLHAALARLAPFEQRGQGFALSPDAVAAHLADVRGALAELAGLMGQGEVGELRPPLHHATLHTPAAPAASPVTLADFTPEWTALGQLARLASRGFARQTYLARCFVEQFGEEGMTNAAAFFAAAARDPGPTAHSSTFPAFRRLLGEAAWDGGAALLSPEAIADAVAALPVALQDRPLALGAQVQWSMRQGQPVLVLNRSFGGGLWLSARYLEERDDHVAMARAYLRQCHGDAHVVALPGTFGQGAGLHPRLLDDELAIPGVDPDRRSARPLPLAGLSARFDARYGKVILCDGTGREVVPVALAAVNPWLLPPMLRLLAEQASGTALSLYSVLWDCFDDAARRSDRAALAMIPELRLGRLVLTRETMLYRSEDLPVDEDLRAMRDRLLLWLERRGLPRHLFLRFPDGPLVRRFAPGHARRATAERHHVKAKPAFYDLGDPFFCDLLRQNLRSGAPLVSIQACDPDVQPGRRAREIQCEFVVGGRP